ncbi:hypothetical protein DPX16_1506 [Anabarilius grahami]|uniref:Uncharacterized protein n=1 Tax=Anabarilius grahami TaxID=495550 RepID=A0A3N0YZF9_ANAGA|nr:hypothetical protein DPX16_1506 [Anabarilius grahami]
MPQISIFWLHLCFIFTLHLAVAEETGSLFFSGVPLQITEVHSSDVNSEKEGLNANLKDEIYARGSPANLNQRVELAIRLDMRFELCRSARVWLPNDQLPSPQQLGGIRIS